MPKYEPFDWYQTPVYYDIIYDTDTKKDATFLEQCHAHHAAPSSHLNPDASRNDAVGSTHAQKLSILEPACGSGRLMAELAERGHRVAGVDLSEPMLDFARQRFKNLGVTGELVHAPMQDFDLKKFSGKQAGFDLAHILVSSFKHLQTEEDAVACLSCICDHLRVGGVFVLGIHLTDPADDNTYLERWRAKRDNLDVICTVRTSPPNHKARTEEMRSRFVVRTPASPGSADEPRRYESNWTFRTYSPNQLRALLRKEPRFNHCATYTFHHQSAIPSSIDSDDLGVVLVLRRER